MLGLGNSLVGGTPISKFTNYSGSFDGTADFVLLPEVAALKPTSALSISLWAKPNAWDMTNGSNDDYFLGCVQAGGWGIYMTNDASEVTQLKGIISVANNGSTSPGYLSPVVSEAVTEAFTGWKHIVMTYDGTTAKLYINGGTTGVTNAAHGVGSAQAIHYHSSIARPVMLGADASSETAGQNFYHGLLDDVAIFNDDLSAAEVTAIYNNGAPFDLTANKGDYVSSGDLVGYWLFEEGTGTSVADSSTNSNNGGVGNAWSWSTDTSG
jgi:hypothetical protein